MKLLLSGVTDPSTTVSLVSGVKVWSPGQKAWVDTSADALVAPAFFADAHHQGLASVDFEGVDAAPGLAVVLHDAAGKPAGDPRPVPAAPAVTIINSGGVINLGPR